MSTDATTARVRRYSPSDGDGPDRWVVEGADGPLAVHADEEAARADAAAAGMSYVLPGLTEERLDAHEQALHDAAADAAERAGQT